jgi:hypothetical protein
MGNFPLCEETVVDADGQEKCELSGTGQLIVLMAYTACKLTYRSRSRNLTLLPSSKKHSEEGTLTMVLDETPSLVKRVPRNGYAKSETRRLKQLDCMQTRLHTASH